MRPTSSQKIIEEIRNVEVFRHIDPAIFALLIRKSHVSSYRDGHALFFSGDECRHLQIVISGGIQLHFASQEGTEVIFSEMQPGDVLGEVEMTLDCRHSFNAVVCGKTRLLEIDRKTFRELSNVPQISSFLIRTVARKLHQATAFAEGMALYPLETRLARLLLSLGAAHGRSVQDGILIEKTISQSRMGQLINASRPRINAQLQAWKSEQLIGISQHRIVIMNKRSLEIISRRPDAIC
jgi:CRP-like cAMP-binding protein